MAEKKDVFLEEIDNELRTLNKRLRNVMSEANALLAEHFGDTEENGENPSEGEKPREDTDDSQNQAASPSVDQG